MSARQKTPCVQGHLRKPHPLLRSSVVLASHHHHKVDGRPQLQHNVSDVVPFTNFRGGNRNRPLGFPGSKESSPATGCGLSDEVPSGVVQESRSVPLLPIRGFKLLLELGHRLGGPASLPHLTAGVVQKLGDKDAGSVQGARNCGTTPPVEGLVWMVGGDRVLWRVFGGSGHVAWAAPWG